MSVKLSAKNFLQDDSGAITVEYGVIASLMFIAIIGVFPTIVNAIKLRFNSIQSPFSNMNG